MTDPNFSPEVLQAVAGNELTVYVYLNDGSVRLCDIKPLIKTGGLFEKLKDRDFFEKVTVMNKTVAWDLSGVRDPCNCIDLDPYMLMECPRVADPLDNNQTT